MNDTYFAFVKRFFLELAYDLQEIQGSDPEAFLKNIRCLCLSILVFTAVIFVLLWVTTNCQFKSKTFFIKRVIMCMLTSICLSIWMWCGFLYDVYCITYGCMQYRDTPLLIYSECIVFLVMKRMIKNHRKD